MTCFGFVFALLAIGSFCILLAMWEVREEIDRRNL